MNKDTQNQYKYSSDYVSLNEFCNELEVAFKELFICELKREDKDFIVGFENGGKFKVTVSKISD